MINPGELLTDLQKLMKALEDDLRERSVEVTKLGDHLRGQYEAAKTAERTAQAYELWRDDYLTQAAAAWILACVFVRFCEDNGLVETARLAGPGERLRLARDQHTLYFREHPTETDREYLLNVFRHVRDLPAMGDLFDERHNPIWEIGLSGDGATRLLEFWQRIEPETGLLVHDFTDGDWNTRFLGDLYQDLSESARKRYALLQTPDFVEEFILDRTLTPAVDEFGYQQVRMIDPACGSGHFLLGAFDRLIDLWQRNETGTNIRELAQRSLNAVYGVDVNPFAVAIARFRLLVATLKACDINKLADAPAFKIYLAAGDSLLHGPRPGIDGVNIGYLDGLGEDDPLKHVYHAEDKEELRRILGQQYHVVVGNPPYIVPKDKALNQAYRERFRSCHMKYSLAVPFKQRMFDLAIAPERGEMAPAGYVGMITANSFMKREFGKKLIEKVMPDWDMTHVIDTSGAYIPGHGTPTVILFGRNRKPIGDVIRTVMGIRGEPSTPEDASKGKVWNAICNQIDKPGSESEFVSVADTERDRFGTHPWSIGGGGAADLKDQLELGFSTKLESIVTSIGPPSFAGVDDMFFSDFRSLLRVGIKSETIRPLINGDVVRDWSVEPSVNCLVPYDNEQDLLPLDRDSMWGRYLWYRRACSEGMVSFNKLTRRDLGEPWWSWYRWIPERLRVPLSIVYAEVATHNHFVLDRGGKVFKQTAPVIKLSAEATEDDHLALIGLLNSSTACFWMKQVCHQKQMMGGDGIRIESKAKVPYAFNGTALGKLPIPSKWIEGPLRERLVELTRLMVGSSNRYSELTAESTIQNGKKNPQAIRSRWDTAVRKREQRRTEQVILQEEIDFTVYAMFGLSNETLCGTVEPPGECWVREGERPFCIYVKENEDGFDVPEGIPENLPPDLGEIFGKRIHAIGNNRELRLIESSHYKRRWIGRQGLFNHQRKKDELSWAAHDWLLNRLESYFDFDGRMNEGSKVTARADIELTSTARVAGIAKVDNEFMQVGELYRNRADFDVAELVAELVESESVPFLPALRYKDSGLRKRQVWEQVWDLQRAEDAIDARVELPEDHPQRLSEEEAADLKAEEVGKIPVPPKYASKDFLPGPSWRLRGKLDVPKERWISYPHCSREVDPSLTIGWAGWNHLQQAQALAAYYVKMKEEEGWTAERLLPLLAGLLEILPWVQQWHNEINPEFNMRMGDYYRDFLNEEVRALRMTLDDLRGWYPPARQGRARRR